MARAIFDLLASKPETVAFAAYRGLKANVAVIVPGIVWRLAWFGLRLMPAPLLAWLTRRVLVRSPSTERRGFPKPGWRTLHRSLRRYRP